ncbi:MAG: hypothetical protein IH991_10075, partial [Planctomycetes bacterium]|nr:hypothetical protein [Planctomycetota bacterium]
MAETNLDESMPPTVIENGVLEVFDPLKNPSSKLTLRDIHLTLRPARDQAD